MNQAPLGLLFNLAAHTAHTHDAPVWNLLHLKTRMRGLRTRRLRGSSLQRLTSDAPDFYRHNGDELRREKKKL